ncbi:ABC transporter permease, partial [bacterium]
GSLRALLIQRLGVTEYSVSANQFFRASLAGELSRSTHLNSCALIHLQGIVTHEKSGARALDVNIYGVDDTFFKFQNATNQEAPRDREAMAGFPLAQRLGMKPGDSLLLRIETGQGVPRESLYGRKENIGKTVRLTCKRILPSDNLGEFSLRPTQGDVYSFFVPLSRLQNDLSQPARANMVLLTGSSNDAAQQIEAALEGNVTLRDLGVHLRPTTSQSGFMVESTRILLDDSIAQAALKAAEEAGTKSSGVFTYLANSIRAGGREIPYSVITAADLRQGAMDAVADVAGMTGRPVRVDGEPIWLNEWAWRDLAIAPGESVEIDYYLWEEEGRLTTRTSRFRFAGAVAIGGDVDAALAPDFPGITEARSIRDWDPPFPLDLRRIRPKDEDYWNRYRATPKAFITLARGQELWQSRFGRYSAVRIAVPEGADPNLTKERLETGIRNRVRPDSTGFRINAVRERGLEAARGSTDFGEYFVYFSFFLIAAALLLAALFFRLGIEQRAREIGTLLAMGFSMNAVRRIFLLEGAVLSIAGSALGLIGAVVYGALLVFGLGNWWIDAVGTRSVTLHVSWLDLISGAAAGILA